MMFLALLSGFLGATASCLGKYAFDPESSVAVWVQKVCRSHLEGALCDHVHYLPRGLCFVAMLVCNAFMLGSFVSGMQESGSVAGTALSSAANFIVSALYGYLLWNERFEAQWWLGFGLVLTGVMVLSTTTKATDGKDKES